MFRSKVRVWISGLGERNWRLLATGTESTKEQSMNFQKWEVTIQQMIEASNREAKEPGKNRILTEWRASLTKTPHNLQPFQIDEIVREVRRRLTTAPQHSSNSNPQSQLKAANSTVSL